MMIKNKICAECVSILTPVYATIIYILPGEADLHICEVVPCDIELLLVKRWTILEHLRLLVDSRSAHLSASY